MKCSTTFNDNDVAVVICVTTRKGIFSDFIPNSKILFSPQIVDWRKIEKRGVKGREKKVKTYFSAQHHRGTELQSQTTTIRTYNVELTIIARKVIQLFSMPCEVGGGRSEVNLL